ARIKELTPEIKPEPSPNPNPNPSPNPTPNPTPEITKPETEKTPDSVKPKNTVNAVGDNSKTGIIEDEQTSAMTAVGLLVLIGLAGTVVMRTKKKNEAH
ncbi:MAG: LPXTG cell wall anchor domain-containing protein, partial [Eubacterium sp.]